jgi:zinc protease
MPARTQPQPEVTLMSDRIKPWAPLLLAIFTLVFAGLAAATPKIQSWDTPNGARVLFVPAPDLPMVDVRVVFNAGSARDGAQPGLASLTQSMLTQGAGEWDADALAERLERVGAELSSGSLRDMAHVSLRTLTDQPALDIAVETMAAILGQPVFARADFDRVRENTLVGLRRDEQDPGTVGKKAVYRMIYGEHPYAGDPAGTLGSVAALQRDDLAAFHRRYYVARNAVVAIVGALTRSEAEALAERVTAALKPGEPAPSLPAVAELESDLLEQLEFPSSQTHVYAGQPGMRRGDPDYFALYVGNHILGGSGLVSLLMEEIRQKRGLSYGVYSYFLPMAERGPFLLGLSTKNEQAAEAREVLMATVRRFREEGPTEDELATAVKNITGGFPLRIASNADVVRYLAMIGFYGLPLDYLDHFTQRVSAVTAQDIRDAFRRRVRPERFATVIVGPPVQQVAKTGN